MDPGRFGRRVLVVPEPPGVDVIGVPDRVAAGGLGAQPIADVRVAKVGAVLGLWQPIQPDPGAGLGHSQAEGQAEQHPQHVAGRDPHGVASCPRYSSS